MIKNWMKKQEMAAHTKKVAGIKKEIERLKAAIARIPDERRQARELAEREYQLRLNEIDYNAERRRIDMEFQVEQLHLEFFKIGGSHEA